MATLLKVPSAQSKGVVVLTSPERDRVVRTDPAIAGRIAALHERWLVGLHHNWHDHAFTYDPLYDFSMAGEGDLVGDTVPLVTLDACNFVPETFRPGGEPFWDVLFVGRPVFFKGFPRFFETVRELYDAGRRDRVLCLCPLPPYEPSDRDTVMYDVREVYERTFSPAERRLFSLVTPEYDYPFPFDLETLAHFYRSSRVFVHLAPDERRCRVAGYAWACGRPVVAAPAVGSLLPPELRRPPLFYAVEEGGSYADRLVDALDSGSAWSATDAEAAERLFSVRHTTEELRRQLARQAGDAGLDGDENGDGDAWALGGLGIRLGRHHEAGSGPNRVSMSLADFVQTLAGDHDLVRAAAREDDPELFLAGRASTGARPSPEGPLRGPLPDGAGAPGFVRRVGAVAAGAAAAILSAVRRRSGRVPVIADRGRRLGDFTRTEVSYPVALVKEEVAREHVFSLPGNGLTFLDVGARDGRLDYLLGIRQNLEIDAELYERNRRRFDAKFRYYGLDLEPAGDDRGDVLSGDICAESFLEEHPRHRESFDVVYSNNVFEHLRRPWVAARNVLGLLRPGGSCITIVPFSIRYHESPEDHFRFTHTGVVALFEAQGPVETVVSGFDITGRRNNWQGSGLHNDTCPVDEFGAWRENWFTVTVLRKPG